MCSQDASRHPRYSALLLDRPLGRGRELPGHHGAHSRRRWKERYGCPRPTPRRTPSGIKAHARTGGTARPALSMRPGRACVLSGRPMARAPIIIAAPGVCHTRTQTGTANNGPQAGVAVQEASRDPIVRSIDRASGNANLTAQHTSAKLQQTGELKSGELQKENPINLGFVRWFCSAIHQPAKRY